MKPLIVLLVMLSVYSCVVDPLMYIRESDRPWRGLRMRHDNGIILILHDNDTLC